MSKNEIEAASATWDRAVEKFLKRLESPRRLSVIERYNCRIVRITRRTPLGIVELHHDWGHCIGPRFVIISILDNKKVAVPYAYAEDADYKCRALDFEPICYGQWFPFSVLEGHPRSGVFGSEVGMVQKDGRTWKFRCYAPDGTRAWCLSRRVLPMLIIRCVHLQNLAIDKMH